MTAQTTEPATTPPEPSAGAEAARPGLDAGTYEVLRARLSDQAGELARRAESLNQQRLSVFGNTELTLIGTERIRTENNCVPRDIVALPVSGPVSGPVPGGGAMLFGYNVFIGLRTETTVDDVFSLHRFVRDGDAFRFDAVSGDASLTLLRDETFLREFGELYRYYKETRLIHLRQVEGKLLAVFQTGAAADDIRVLRWQVAVDGTVTYLDNRGERDHVFPPAHDFEWIETTRDQHVLGRHPHISIEDLVFVETTDGDLTIKVENNTESGEGIYSEPVTEPLQSLADADVHYARVGPLVLLRIRPYKETEWRHLVFNTRTRSVVRLDGIGQACQRLPEDQGLIFPGGYYLSTGVAKTFDADVEDLEFERAIRSPNGEDVLYVFHARADGRSLLLPYNVIRKEVATPIPCHGYSLFDDGTLVIFRADNDEPTRVHPMQVWRTPYVSDTYAAAQPLGTGPLERIGNAELVRGISDCLSVQRMIGEMAPSTAVFEAIIAACTRVFDSYHWLGEAELGDLRLPLTEIRGTAEQVLEEFENVQTLTAQAVQALDDAAANVEVLARRVRGEAPPGGGGAWGEARAGGETQRAQDWVAQLAELRKAQGQLETLRELRYVDTARIDSLAERLDAELGEAAKRAVAFLEQPDAFAGYTESVGRLTADAGAIATVAEAVPVAESLTSQAEGLQVVTEVVGSLEIADATVRTAILQRIGEVLAGVNQARATLDARRRELLDSEGRAEFTAELALLAQSVTGALAMASTPEACDEQLGKLLLSLENLESRFAEFDDFLGELTAKRTEIYEALSARKQTLLDERTRRTDRLVESAERILSTVQRRAAGLESLDDVNTYFASDPMVAKVRSVAAELRSLGDSVRAEELDGRVKAARQEAGRSLRDRLDLFGAGGQTIRLGKHDFAVNTQPLDLTLVPQDGRLVFAITGTDYRGPVRDETFEGTKPFWEQSLVSETAGIYRAEFLAVSVLENLPSLVEDDLLGAVRKVAESRYDEGYELGVHDHDAAQILAALLRLRAGAGLLRYPPAARAAAQLFWAFGTDEAARKVWTTRAGSLSRARSTFGHSPAIDELRVELGTAIAEFCGTNGLPFDVELAGEYLFEELADSPLAFVTSGGVRTLLEKFDRAAGTARKQLDADLAALDDLGDRHQLVSAWLEAFDGNAGSPSPELAEAAAVKLCGPELPRHDSSAALTATVEGLLGSHPRISERRLTLRLDETLARVRRFRARRVPAYRAYQKQRSELVTRERARLRLTEYQPKVMSSFVRNQLLDEVYLPLIGDNLAKQLGAAGDAKRTDQMGLLLLISPPGYGKTTLMEYVANRLGLVFVKVNGPALGHSVSSLDPAEARSATARQEIEKISFALELGNNALLYLDDIQHTSPELLQKFISLCDAQRRIEGVWDGATRTYDLRGKRFAVCMAGNPYTESGQRFRVPDMLANRADVWNLGDVLSGRDELFALSYVENALTSNSVLSPLSTRDRADVPLLVRLAAGDESVQPDRLSHPYSAVELEQVLSVLRKLSRVQEVVLSVNQAYIASAGQAEASRVEPAFLLQGSYRNMNKLAERIVPAMNDAELDAVIDDHYLGEAQTLTSGAEANLLKLAELRGRLSETQAARWAEVKAAYLRSRALGGAEDDPVARAVGAVGLLADKVSAIESAIREAGSR